MEETTLQSLRNSRRIVWAFFLFGAVATILVNLAYADDSFGPKALSIVAPISVLGTVEILGRVPFRQTWVWRLNKYLLAAAVGGAALFVSYYHTAHLAIRYGNDPIVAWTQPLVTDGMMVISALALISIKEHMDMKMQELKKEQAELAEEERKKMLAAEEAASEEIRLTEELGQYKGKVSQLEAELEDAIANTVVPEVDDPFDSDSSPEVHRAHERNRARETYLRSVNLNPDEPIMVEELADMFSQTISWAEARITEVEFDMKPIPVAAVS